MSTKAIREALARFNVVAVDSGAMDADVAASLAAALDECRSIEQAAKTADVQWEYTGTNNVEWGAWRKAMDTLQAIAKDAP